MSSLSVLHVNGPSDQVAEGLLQLDTRDGFRTPVSYRLARNSADLTLATWSPVLADVMQIPWLFGGYQVDTTISTFAEIAYSSEVNTILSVDHISCQRPTSGPARIPYNFPPGFLVQGLVNSPTDKLIQSYGEPSTQVGNIFVPLDFGVDPSGGGYGWNSEQTRLIDVGETPNDIIVAHISASWISSSVNSWDFSPNTTCYSTRLGSSNLDLKGGRAVLAVVCDFPDGRRGRYHLVGSSGSPRNLAIGSGTSWASTYRGFPSGSSPDWVCTWGANGVPISGMPAGPSFQITFLEIILRDFTSTPTGQLFIKELSIPQ